MGSIAAAVASGATPSDGISTFSLVLLLSGSLLFLLGAAYILGTIEEERRQQHRILLSSAALPLFVVFLTIMIRESLPFLVEWGP